MVEVKFRIIYLDKEERAAHGGKYSIWTPKNQCCSLNGVMTSPDYAVDQYAGITDKDGGDIYTRDIVELRYKVVSEAEDYDGDGTISGMWVGLVVILPSMGVCLSSPRCVDESSPHGINEHPRYKMVRGYRSAVIGNVHENPELLKGPIKDEEPIPF